MERHNNLSRNLGDDMSGTYFVMLTTQDGGYTPLMSAEGDEIAKFDNEKDASTAAKGNILGEHFGYEIFQRGCGEIYG